jgi:hypothetical protein
MKKTLLSLAIASLAAGQSVCAAVEKVYNEPDSVYIFSYAHPEDEGRSGLKFAWSPDGDKWLSVSDGFAYLKCDFGRWGAEKRMIKPLLEKAEDGRWYCRWQLTPSGKVWGTSHSSALLTAATQFAYRVMTASTRILTRHSGCHYRNRFGPHILAEQKIFMISQTAGLMIPPQIAQRLAFLQRSYRAFPIINIVHTISVSHTSAGETDKTGMKVRQSLCQIGAQPVLPAFKCILWEKRNHIQGILPSHLRTNGQYL